MKPWLSISEAAELLGVSSQTLRRWDRAGKLRARRHPVNGYRIYLRAELEAFPQALHHRPELSALGAEPKALVDWGMEDADKLVLIQCAHFRGPFTLEDGVAVVEAGRPALDAAGPLQSLEDRGLVVQTDDLFEVDAALLELARAALGEPERIRLLERLAHHFAAVARECSSNRSTAALLRISQSEANLEQAFDWGVEADTSAAAGVVADTAIALSRLVELRGTSAQAIERLQTALSTADRFELGSGPQAWLEVELGRLLFESDDFEAAREHHHKGLLLARQSDHVESQVIALSQLGHMAMLTKRGASEVTALLDQARDLSERCADRWYEALVLGVLANARLKEDDRLAARALYDRCRALAHLAGDHAQEGMALGILGNIDQDAGLVQDAQAAYGRAIELFSQARADPARAIFTGYLATAFEELGETARAHATYARATRALSHHGLGRFEALFRAGLSATAAMLGGGSIAQRELEAARVLCQSLPATVQAAVETRAGHVHLWRARTGERSDRERALHLAYAIDRLQKGEQDTDDERFAFRRLRHALQDELSAPSNTTPRADLLVGPLGAWFQQGSGLVDLRARSALPRLLWRLVLGHLETPGRGVTAEHLLCAGWPGERMREAAGAHRLRVAIATLRKLALADALRTVEGGYALAEELSVAIGGFDPH
jgi:excisionase family DNA binding protein